MLLTSLNRLRYYIGGAENPLDNTLANNRELRMWLVSISSRIENFLGRSIHIESRTEYFDATYNRIIFYPAAYPITSITSVYEDSLGMFDGSTEAIIESTNYHLDFESRAIVLVYERSYVADRAIRIIYTGGMALDPVQSVFAVTKTGSWTVNNYVTGGTSGAVGILRADNTTSFTIEVLYGVFSVGETITEQSTEGGSDTAGVSATLDSVTSRALVESYPEVVTACEMEVRYNWKHKMDYENASTDKDSTNRRTEGTGKLQPETMAMLNPYRNLYIPHG